MSDDTYIVIETTGEAVDFTSPSTSPAALKRAAALRAQAEKPPDPRFPVPPQPEPEPPSLAEMIGHRYRRIDDVVDYEAEDSARRTARAHFEIMRAVEQEKQEVEQQRKQDLADARAKVRQTALGRLLGDTRHG
jgi:hypothetical protein